METLENLASEKSLRGKEIWMFTDNSTCKGAFYKGTSTSQLLFDLVLRLRVLALHSGFKLHLVHVSGTRMMAQGSDGLSRGDLLE